MQSCAPSAHAVDPQALPVPRRFLKFLRAFSHTLIGTLFYHVCWQKLLSLKMCIFRASLVAQWLRIRLPMQGKRVRSLAQEDPTCRGANKPVCHNY